MKTEIQNIPQPTSFAPFRLVIEVETEQEARVLGATYGLCNTMADILIREGYGLTGIDHGFVRDTLCTVGKGVDDYLISHGIDRVGEE